MIQVIKLGELYTLCTYLLVYAYAVAYKQARPRIRD